MKTISDVTDFIRECMDDHDLAFHPDTPFHDYVDMETGKPTFTPAQADALQERLEQAFEICEKEDVDIYGLACDAYLASPQEVLLSEIVEIGKRKDLTETQKRQRMADAVIRKAINEINENEN